MNQEKNQKIREFTDLLAWKEGHKLVLLIYAETKKFPKEEIFGLTSQIRRAAISVTSNISEGFGRQSAKEKVYFYYLAHGSITELKNQLLIARDLNYIDNFQKIEGQLIITHKLLQGLLKKTKTFLNPES